MESYAHRIRRLREERGLSHAEAARVIGISLPTYYDLESHDSETTQGLDLRQLSRLADLFGVSLRRLLVGLEDAAAKRPDGSGFDELADRLRGRVADLGINAVEEGVGWRLQDFLADPKTAWDEPLDFLRFVCEFLGIDWREKVPVALPPVP